MRLLTKQNTFIVTFGDAKFTCRPLPLRELRQLESGAGNAALIACLSEAILGWSNVLVEDEHAIDTLKEAGAELLPTAQEGVFEVKYRSDLVDLIFDVTDAGVMLGLIAQGNTKR